MAAKAKIPLVATNQVRFMEEEEFEAHETRVCIQTGNVLELLVYPQTTQTFHLLI